MPILVEKETLVPGVYNKNGRRMIVTRQDCRDYFDSVRDLHAKTNLRVPLVLEHPKPDRTVDDEGFPLSSQDLDDKVAMLRQTVGASVWNAACRINERGAAVLSYEVKDEDVGRQLKNKSIKFVSPELRPLGWTDGLGNHYPKLITHVALTHKPIQVDQQPGFVALSSDEPILLSALSEPVWLSQSDLIPGETLEDLPLSKTKPAAKSTPKKLLAGHLQKFLDQLADDDAEGKKKTPPPPGGATPPATGDAGETLEVEEENPDMPKGEGDKKQIEALVAHLREAGFVLPADTSKDNLVSYLLVAVMTKNAADAESEASDRDADQGAAQELSPTGIAQMSSKIDQGEARRRLVSRIQGCRTLPSPTRDDLLVRVGAVQFSDDGTERIPAGGISIADAVAMFENQATQFSDGTPQAALAERIKKARTAGKVQPGVADQLLAKVGVVQFSDDGVEVVPAGGISLSSVLDSVEKSASLVGSLLEDKSAGYQFSAAEASHPGGDAFMIGSTVIQPGDARATKIAQDFIKRQGQKLRSENSTAINASNA